MTRKEFEKKYKTEIALMAKAQDVDMGVATGMLIAHVKSRNVDTPHKYDFPGQENLNYTELVKEIAKIEATAAVLRQA
ncbi:MAG: hypothetical protein WBJ13_14830 [Sedimentibacter sp.]